MTTSNEKKLTKKDITRMFWRSFTVNASFNYERHMSQGCQYALSPILTKLYPKKEELAEALKRHAEFFNSTPMIDPFIFASPGRRNCMLPGSDRESVCSDFIFTVV